MSDASQVRINELARELEVKAKAIIDLLPGFGVTEKKTHSSSIPVEVAEKVRQAIRGTADAEAAEAAAKEAAARAAAKKPVAPAPAAPPPAAAKPVAPPAAHPRSCSCTGGSAAGGDQACARGPSARCASRSGSGCGQARCTRRRPRDCRGHAREACCASTIGSGAGGS